MHIPIKFHHAVFNHSTIIMLTNNKHTNKVILSKTPISLCYAMPVDNNVKSFQSHVGPRGDIDVPSATHQLTLQYHGYGACT